MTDLRTAAQQALEALENASDIMDSWAQKRQDDAITALRAALAEPQVWVCPDSAEHRYAKPGHCEDCGKTLVQVAEPVQEPVAWMVYTLDGKSVCVTDNPADFTDEHKVLPLYTAPPAHGIWGDE